MIKFEVIEFGYRTDFEKAINYIINNYKVKTLNMFPVKNKSPRYSAWVIYEIPKQEHIKQDEVNND